MGVGNTTKRNIIHISDLITTLLEVLVCSRANKTDMRNIFTLELGTEPPTALAPEPAMCRWKRYEMFLKCAGAAVMDVCLQDSEERPS